MALFAVAVIAQAPVLGGGACFKHVPWLTLLRTHNTRGKSHKID